VSKEQKLPSTCNVETKRWNLQSCLKRKQKDVHGIYWFPFAFAWGSSVNF